MESEERRRGILLAPAPAPAPAGEDVTDPTRGEPKSKLGLGVAKGDSVLAIDFRRRGGKYPSVRRGSRAISTGWAVGEEERRTQRTCVYGGSSSSVVPLSIWLFMLDVTCREGGRLADSGVGERMPFAKGVSSARLGGSSSSGVGARRSTL